jgi:hypothetical protein
MLELKLDLRCLTDIDEYSAEPQEPRLNLDRPPPSTLGVVCTLLATSTKIIYATQQYIDVLHIAL